MRNVCVGLLVLLLSTLPAVAGELVVTRHVIDEPDDTIDAPVGVMIFGLNPASTSVQIECLAVNCPWGLEVNITHTNNNVIRYSYGHVFVGVAPYFDTTPWYRVCEAPEGGNCGPWYPEVPLACFGDVPNGGCDPTIYHREEAP
jgi:hypothetical protein